MKVPLLFSLSLLFFSCSSTVNKNNRNFKIFAHRGASSYLPEHTLEAYAYAHALKVDFIEPDVVLTKDNVPICLHDIHLEGTTNVEDIFPQKKRSDGRWYAADLSLEEIKRLEVHERENKGRRVFPKRFPKNHSSFTVPTFVEFIELIQGLNSTTMRTVGIYPEIKAPEFHQKEKKDITKIVYEVLKKYGYEKNTDQIFLQSFHPGTLKRLKNQFKTKIPLTQLVADNSWGESSADYEYMRTKQGILEVKTYAKGMGVWIKHLKDEPHFLTNIKDAGLLLHAYTLRPEKVNKTTLEIFKQADGIFSDSPDFLHHQ